MSGKRDDFSDKDKRTVALRVGARCSNPNCPNTTHGPHPNPSKYLSLGEAAHITAAAPGGPRFNPELTSEQRKSIDNAIWLCRICARLVDIDAEGHSEDILREWKRRAEQAAEANLNARSEARAYWALEVKSHTPPASDPNTFKGRTKILAELKKALRGEGARIGLFGLPGIGKTRVVRHFFQHKGNALYDPFWLRVDDLFSRTPSGHQEPHTRQWNPADVLDHLADIARRRPRLVLVFDNVQADPVATDYLAARLGHIPAIFIAWDAGALPACDAILRVNALSDGESEALVGAFCHPTLSDKEAVRELCDLLDNYPLLLTLAGRRLKTLPLAVHDLCKELKAASTRLLLNGPSLDHGRVVVHAVLDTSFQCLEEPERKALCAIAAFPSDGASVPAIGWLMRRFKRDRSVRFDRAVELGFLEMRPSPDWRGHQYRLRSTISDFLRSSALFSEAAAVTQEYLSSSDVFRDISVDLVLQAVSQRLDTIYVPGQAEHVSHSTDLNWLKDLLVSANPTIRRALVDVLHRVERDDQRKAINDTITETLSELRREDLTIDLIKLASQLDGGSQRDLLTRLWLSPECEYKRDHTILISREVRSCAAFALAKANGQSVEDFLASRLSVDRSSHMKQALDVASFRKVRDVLPAIGGLLQSSDSQSRYLAMQALSGYEPVGELSDRLYELAHCDPEERVREKAAGTLGVWKDSRAVPLLLDQLTYSKKNERERASLCSVLWRFANLPEVAECLFAVAKEDPCGNAGAMATFCLVDAEDPRGGELWWRLLQCPARRPRTTGACLGFLLREDSNYYKSLPEMIAGTLASWLEGEDLETRLLARCSLLGLRDVRATVGFLQDVEWKTSGPAGGNPRWNAVFCLARWAPPRFDFTALRALIHDPDPSMRAVTSLVMGKWRVRALVPEIEILLDDHSPLDDSIRILCFGVDGSGRDVADVASASLDRIVGKGLPWKLLRPSFRP